eukprot:TRINITY_DN7173_c0_g1_i1.p1 TRINITY_DN7173_c0_g1~~TRINITY_DN7173_c0_g1_i1.p1  ORF type:complete len:147 (+),score=13.87 TRINITY_DN7173_c0_g1_i1:78-518(+)
MSDRIKAMKYRRRRHWSFGKFGSGLVSPTHRRVASGYDIWATIYDIEKNPLIALEKKYYPNELVKPCVRGGTVVDIGCGTGRNIARMLDFEASSVIGLDVSEGMLQKAKLRFAGDSRVKLMQHDILKKEKSTDCDSALIPLLCVHG